MGLLGNYLAVREENLDAMANMDGEALGEYIEDLSDAEDALLYDIDTLWDGLHFWLTGVSATTPVEGNPLSEAVVGVHGFNPEEAGEDFAACTELDELPPIIAAMEAVDLAALRQSFDAAAFHANDIYPPALWGSETPENLCGELTEAFEDLLAFYKAAQKQSKHVVFSVY